MGGNHADPFARVQRFATFAEAHQETLGTPARQIEHRCLVQLANIDAMPLAFGKGVSPPCRFELIDDSMQQQYLDIWRHKLRARNTDTEPRGLRFVRPRRIPDELQVWEHPCEILRRHVAVLEVKEQPP